MTDEKNIPQTAEEKKSLKLAVLEQVSTLATAGFGLVAALAWNDAIRVLFDSVFPSPEGSLVAKLTYAFVITAVVVVVTIQLGKAVNLAKKQLSKDRESRPF